MTGPRLAADVLALPFLTDEDAVAVTDALLAGADMVALVRTDAGVEVRGVESTCGATISDGPPFVRQTFRLVDAPVPADTYVGGWDQHTPLPGDVDGESLA